MPKLYRRGRFWWVWFRGERRSTRCEDITAARAVVRGWERSAADPGNRAQDQAALADAIRAFAASKVAAGRAAGTMHMYGVKTAHLARLLPARLCEIDAVQVDRYLAVRLEEGAARNTIAKEMTALRGVLALAKRHGLWRSSLAEVMPIAWDAAYKPRTTSLSPSEVWALCGELRPDRAACVAFMVATGAEWGAVGRARRGDLVGGVVHLRGTKRATRDRRTPLPPNALRLALAALSAAGPDLLFAPWANVRRDLAAACERAGVPAVTPNDLRRTFGQWLRQGGVEPHAIGAAMGHADSRMVERVYGRLTPEKLAPLLVTPYTDSTAGGAEAENADETAWFVGIENPRVGGSIPSLGTRKAGDFALAAGSTEPTGCHETAPLPYTDRTRSKCAAALSVEEPDDEQPEPWLSSPAWLAELQRRAEAGGRP